MNPHYHPYSELPSPHSPPPDAGGYANGHHVEHHFPHHHHHHGNNGGVKVCAGCGGNYHFILYLLSIVYIVAGPRGAELYEMNGILWGCGKRQLRLHAILLMPLWTVQYRVFTYNLFIKCCCDCNSTRLQANSNGENRTSNTILRWVNVFALRRMCLRRKSDQSSPLCWQALR